MSRFQFPFSEVARRNDDADTSRLLAQYDHTAVYDRLDCRGLIPTSVEFAIFYGRTSLRSHDIEPLEARKKGTP